MAFNAPTINNAGMTVAATSTSTAYLMPKQAANLSDIARIVRVICDQNSCFVKFGPAGVVATTADIMITPQSSILTVTGSDHFAVLQNGALACNLNITPLSW
jgi:hypothetical protein